MNQKEIALRTGLSEARISQIFNGAKVGERSARKFADFCGGRIEWVEFLIMPPEEIRAVLLAAADGRKRKRRAR